jgi:hypothetical protein
MQQGEPPTPKLQSASFTSTGAQLSILFDLATDRAGISAEFRCRDLLSFTDDAALTCYWVSDTEIRANLQPATRVVPGDTLGVRGFGLVCCIAYIASYSNRL